MSGLALGIVGATGAVGREMRSILEEHAIPVREMRLFASPDSEGTRLTFRGEELRTGVLAEGCFDGLDAVLFSAGAGTARTWAPVAAAAGCAVIDNSSAFRGDVDIPLVVPEVNADTLPRLGRGGCIVANPNCSTIQLVVAVAPLARAFGLAHMTVCTYQSVSGAGQKGIKELSEQVVALLNFRPVEANVFPAQIAFNVLPEAGSFEGAHTTEELKVINESRRILDLPGLPVSVNCARVPVFACHSESVFLRFDRAVTPAEATEVLASAEGIEIVDDPSRHIYPTARAAAGKDAVQVGRIREDLGVPGGIAMWVVADNLRKGAALNAVQILERMHAESGGLST